MSPLPVAAPSAPLSPVHARKTKPAPPRWHTAVADFNEALLALAAAEEHHRETEATLVALDMPGDRRSWLRKRTAADRLRDARWLATDARGELLSAYLLRPGPLVPSGTHGVRAFEKLRQSWHPRLVDHDVPYRFVGSRGPATLRDTVLVSEPYLGADDDTVAAALERGMPLLDKLGLVARLLPRHLLLHAPHIERSQILLIGSPELLHTPR